MTVHHLLNLASAARLTGQLGLAWAYALAARNQRGT